MKILGRTQMIQDGTISEAVKRLMAKGFDGVEISSYNKKFDLHSEFFSEGFSAKIKDTLAECGVTAYSIFAHMDYVVDDERYEYVKRIIRIGGEIASPVIIVTGGMDGKSPERDTLYAKQVQRTRELCKIAAGNGVTLAVEFEPNFVVGTTKQTLKLLEDVDSESLRINLDIGHVFLADPDPMEAIASCRGLMIHAHIENMAKGVHNHIVPYEGDMDLREYFRQMQAIGFDGFASIDLYQYDYEAVAERSIRFIRDTWESLLQMNNK